MPIPRQGIRLAVADLGTTTDDEGETWRDEALCATRGVEALTQWYFEIPAHVVFVEETWSTPTTGKRLKEHLRRLEFARNTCSDCPVREECLQYGMKHVEAYDGIFGGLTRAQRLAVAATWKMFAEYGYGPLIPT